MRTRMLFGLVRQNLHRNWRNLALASVGIVVGIGMLVFFVALGNGIYRAVEQRILPGESNRFQVVPRTAQFGTVGPGRVLDDRAIEDLRRVAGVKAVYPRMKFAFLATCSLDGSRLAERTIELIRRVPGVTESTVRAIRSIRMWLEIMGEGIDPRLVAKDVVAGKFADPGPGKPIPVVISKEMVEIYNTSFAPARGLPRISEHVLQFLPHFPLTLNDSFVRRNATGPKLHTYMKIVGISHWAMMAGITVPLDVARRLNRRFAGELAAQRYTAAVVEVSSPRLLPAVQQHVREMGFDVDMGRQRMAERVGMLIALVTLGFGFVSLVIVALAAVSISHTFFMIISERKREIGLMRALGATRRDVAATFLGEAAAVGLLCGLLGTVAGSSLALAADWLAVEAIPDFPFKPDAFFAYPWWLFASAPCFAVVFSVAGAVFPSRKAARLDPASALTTR